MFKNLFAPKQKESKKIVLNNQLLIGKKDRNNKEIQVTKILLPEESLTLTKDDKIVLTQIEDAIVLVKLLPEMNEGFSKNAAQYNIGDNSINSSTIAEKLKDIFIIDEDEFKLEATLTTIENIEVLILNKINISSEENL
jgi:hypothetical protein